MPQWQAQSARLDSTFERKIAQGENDAEQRHQAAWSHLQQQADGAAPTDRIDHYHCDYLGTPRELIDQRGKLVWGGHYKAWGRLNSVDYQLVAQPLRFQGQYEDQETGLHYNRYRYYDPEAGRYFTQDPAGLIGGENGYTYSPNPNGWIDPLGLQKKCGPCCAGGRFSTADAAARAALTRYNGKSIRDNLEYGGLIYKGKNGKYDFTKAIKGDLDGVNPWAGKQVPKSCEEVGYWHTHGNYSDRNGVATTRSKDSFDSNNFSRADIDAANFESAGKSEYRGYLGTPSGDFKGYNSKTGFKYSL